MTTDWRETLKAAGLGSGYAGRHVDAITVMAKFAATDYPTHSLYELANYGYVEFCHEPGHPPGCVVLTEKVT